MNDPLSWIEAVALARANRGLSRRLKIADSSVGPFPSVRIAAEGRELINFSSNDYLGLANDPRSSEAAIREIEASGWGSAASPLVSGWRPAHESLANELARFERTEAVALFSSGFAANIGAIVALVAVDDAVYLDRLNHASLVAGAKLSGARLRVYRHRDANRLADLLHRERHKYRRALIATDGVFSMDGDLAPIADLVDLAERFDAMLLVDEAHGTGVFGANGRGACSELFAEERVPIRVGTLSKALGSIGGFVAGSKRLIEHLIETAPSLIYSTALPAAAAAAARENLRILQAEPWRQKRVRELGNQLRAALARTVVLEPDSIGPIVPVPIGDSRRALSIAERLRSRNLFVSAIRPPTVPPGTDRLRVSLSAIHSDEDVSLLIDALVEILGDEKDTPV